MRPLPPPTLIPIMSNDMNPSPTRPRDGWVTLGMVVSATSAALTSFDGLRQLALAAGWTSLMAPLLPLTIDAFAATATRVWLLRSTGSKRSRRFARACAVGAILFSLAGNAVYHLIAANLLVATWFIVLGVGAIPPVILGLVSHLAVLRSQQDQEVVPTVPTAVPKTTAVRATPASGTTSREKSVALTRPEYGDQASLLEAARSVDAQHRERFGRPISRDELRRQLKIGSHKASEALRLLRVQPENETGPIPQQPQA